MKTLHPIAAALLALLSISSAAYSQVPYRQAPGAADNLPDPQRYPTADALWAHILDMQRGPRTQARSAAEHQQMMQALVSRIDADAGDFMKLYSSDPRIWDARLLQIDADAMLYHYAGHQDNVAQTAALQDLAGRMDASPDVRMKARYQLLNLAVTGCMGGDKSFTPDAIVAQLHQFISEFPTFQSLDSLRYTIAETLKPSAPDAAAGLLKELAVSDQGKFGDLARQELTADSKKQSQIKLKFTAMDGAQVDISQMRGKVVLVDFWATWCGPCRGEIPNVIQAYQRLHSHGFEIIGISLDRDRNALTNYLAQSAMPWPQYFDGLGWGNAISSAFGIHSIPAMWLVNKKGYVVSTNGRDDLEGQVERLLAESDTN